jgi:hypothetical protein
MIRACSKATTCPLTQPRAHRRPGRTLHSLDSTVITGRSCYVVNLIVLAEEVLIAVDI